MGGAERIVHVGVHPLDQPGDEGGVVGLLTGIEPEVLEQLRPGRQLGEPGTDRIHRVPGIRLPLRSAEVAGAHHRRPPILQPGDGGEGGADAEVVRDLVAFQRHVEVCADEHPLSLHRGQVLQQGQAVHPASLAPV